MASNRSSTHVFPSAVSTPPSGSAARAFLGWDGSLLERAAAHLIDGADSPMDLAGALVAVPGARAGRTLLGFLARAAKARGWNGFFPPRVLTQGRLVDELLIVETPTADRPTRTLAWERALKRAEPDVLSRLVAQVPPRSDRAQWWRIAEDLRTLHAELAVEGYGFQRVRDILGSGEAGAAVPASEIKRWEALASVQLAWREELGGIGQVDPHEARFQSLEAGHIRRDADVVLVGIAEVSGLLARTLPLLDSPARALVFAPESEAAAFDALGSISAAHWMERSVDLPLERWSVVTTPDDQARLAAAFAASADGLEHAGDLALGVADEEVAPYLVRRFDAAGIRARDAAGTPFSGTAPARLLAQLRAFLETRSSSAFAALVRHPDLERVLLRLTEVDPVAVTDDYRPEFLPRRFDVRKPDVPAEAHRRHRDGAPMEELLLALGGVLGPLADESERSLPRAADDLREMLGQVYNDHPLLAWDDVEPDDARSLRLAIEGLAAALVTLENVPESVAGKASPAAALGLLARIGETEVQIPPAPASDAEPTVEMLGWLELLLDPAPFLVVTGFNEGRVPAGGGGDSFLPDRVRAALGLEDERRRTARDVYITRALLASRGERVLFVSGRRTREGDPLFPSRLAFFSPTNEAGERVDHALEAQAFAPVEREERGDADPVPYILERAAQDTFAVTAFKAYIESPALFHIRRVLKAETVLDAVGELDPRRFGTFTHEVLESFAKSRSKGSTDAAEIYRFLEKSVAKLRKAFFPEELLPAVPLQIEQLKLRLQSFAEWQAQSADDGWQIRQVEWSPNDGKDADRRGCIELPMGDDEAPAWVRGKIDRIDQHVDGRWRVLDYKTSHKDAEPDKVHRKVNKKAGTVEWRDLQLPLYAHMTQELTGNLAKGGAVPELGYVNLPGNGAPVSLRLVSGWDVPVIEGALDKAREVVRSVRKGEFAETGKLRFLQPIEEELLGIGLVVPPDAGDDETYGDGEGGAA